MLLTCYVFGARHDYLAYLNHWNLLLEGKNSWATNETNVGHNAYGPFHSFSAYLLISCLYFLISILSNLE